MAVTIDQTELGFTWTLDEPIGRSSHALRDGDRIWLVDPTDRPEALELLAGLGKPDGVIQLLDRHNRDCAALAARFGVPHRRVPDALPGTPFQVIPLLRVPGWREVALWWPAAGALAVAEAVATAPMYAPAAEGAAIQILLRPRPPRSLRYFAPEHLLVGHGPPIHGTAATDALHAALRRSRRDIPRAAMALLRAGGTRL